jgi:hypothetical protein
MARGKRRAGRKLSRWGLPAALSFTLWLADNDPFGLSGLTLFLGLAVLLSVFWPVALIMLLQAPGSLVPNSWRIWWRGGEPERPHIPDWLRRAVYAADGRRCCYCGYAGSLQLDHFRPWSCGGRTSLLNCFALCRNCNIIKSNYWPHRSGRITYRPFEGRGNLKIAAAILEAERRARRNPLRWLRAGLAL